jgi:hypothetical protein
MEDRDLSAPPKKRALQGNNRNEERTECCSGEDKVFQ